MVNKKPFRCEERLPKFKDCVHSYRFVEKVVGLDKFYCINCLRYSFKFPDNDKKALNKLLKEWIEYKKYDERG